MDFTYASSLRTGILESSYYYKTKAPVDLPLETPIRKYRMESDALLNAMESQNKHNNTKKLKKKSHGKKKEIKKGRKRKDVNNEARLRALADPNRMWNLRMKFMEQLKTYFGVPYAKKYWKPDEPEYSSPYFLDCCGLIRRVMRDLKKDFGFKIGPWNQGYMYDTLPITIENEEDMKPGDLVFIAATYYNPKMKKQKHDITHVEVWYGDGPKTIGSRWHRGHVQIFDSYSFEPKAYHSERYIFKSIDTWLMGICRSHCPEHQWKLRSENFKPGKKSVFALSKKKKKEEQEDEENASDAEQSPAKSSNRRPLQSQDNNRPTRTPRSIGIGLEDDDSDDTDDDSDDESTTTATTGDTTSDTASVTTTTSNATATTATTTTTTTTGSEETSSVATSSLAETSSVTQSSDVVSQISTTVSETEERKNCRRDFAKSNPREGKESDSQRKRNSKCVLSYSNGASARISSPYSRLDTDLDGNPITSERKPRDDPAKVDEILPAEGASFIYDEKSNAWTVANLVYDEACKMWMPSSVVIEYGDESDDELASVDSEQEIENPVDESDNAIAAEGTSIECQTGVDFGHSPHMLRGDKWTSPVNMLCYASVYKGEAAVQVKNPDLISDTGSSTTSSCLGDDEGYLPQEQSSYSEDIADEVPKSAAEMMFSFRQSPSVMSEDSGVPRSENASTCISSSRPSSAASLAARVGSAGVFQAPAVTTLYSENSDESSSSSISAHTNVLPVCGDAETPSNEGDSETPPGDADEKQGVNTPAGTPISLQESGALPTGQTSRDKDRKNGRKNKKGGDDKKPDGIKARVNALAQPKEPTFFIAGANGTALVESTLLEIGWKRMTNRYDDNFKLKWVESKSSINYHTFKGDKLVNRLPNCSLLTNKLGLLNSIDRYERVCQQLSGGAENRFSSRDFLPETYRIDDHTERCTFFETYQPGEIWICKPCGLNQGKGIFLVRDIVEFQKALEERDEKQKTSTSTRPMERIVQRYIEKPLLLDNRKFDIRAYMLIASTTPFLLCYHPGYCRLCLYPYSERSDNLVGHLTNQFVQKKDINYKEYKEETVWSMERFNEYVNEIYAEKKGIEKDWVFNTLTNRMKQIIMYIFNAVKHKLKCRRGFFDLYGLDFMVDSNMKIYLIEVNANPCLATNCEVLKEVVPNVVRESLYLAIECFEKSKRGQPLLPLHCLTNFQMLYCGNITRPPSPPRQCITNPRIHSPYRQRSQSPLHTSRRSRSVSPEKDTSIQVPTSQQLHMPSAQMEEHFRNTARIYTSAKIKRPSSTAPRIVSCPAPSTPRHGLRGALPELEKSNAINDATYADIFKFKMTHAALMSSIKAEQAQKKVLMERKPLAPEAGVVTAVTSHSMSQSLSHDDFGTSYAQPRQGVVHSASSHNLGSASGGHTQSQSESARAARGSMSSSHLSGTSIAGGHFSPTKLSPRPSMGVNITANNHNGIGRQYIFPTSNATIRTQAVMSPSSIPVIRHGQSDANTTIIGTAVKRSERGS